ncbi:sensor histidine kinase [Nocardia goodfellowii]|uniref:histidine kinase n=1 Tax=Nocardia goodfellowii TaxID=882446 RepID=A0ABS4QGS3_9NOCA|nr:sensor histidine kinase [Nocardia goodfellowii]MBP2190872.1 signal transduction histidine kinase [Nocardia goodfellowii]
MTPSLERPRGAGRLTVEGWFQVVLASMILLAAVGTILGAQVIKDTNRASDRLLNKSLPAAAETYRLQSALLDQETGLRGFAIAGDRALLTPYTEGKITEAAAIARLRELLAGRDKLLADLDAVQSTAQSWRDDYAEPVVGTAAVGPFFAPNVVRGKEIFDALRTRFVIQNADLDAAIEQDRAELADTRRVRDTVLGGIVGGFVLLGVVMLILVRRLVARPLKYLEDASARVSAGEFDHHITVRGPADLATVARSVEAMRRRIVAELAASRGQEAVLAQQATDLDAQTVELRRSNAELEQFAYVASHDLQEPLRKVASFCQLLEKRYGDQLDDRGKQYIDYAVDGAKRMQVLINDLLTFSRVGRVNDSNVPTDLGQTLDKALSNLATVIEDTDARIERPEELPEIAGDPTLLTMLWQNLIGNAIKFRRPEQAPVIRIECAAGPAESGGWEFTVTDNGIGIAPEFADKVFVIFQRLHSRDEYSGTGIGLALCKKIVEFHGGTIRIDTGYTEGTRFCFTLNPAVIEEPAVIDQGVPA